MRTKNLICTSLLSIFVITSTGLMGGCASNAENNGADRADSKGDVAQTTLDPQTLADLQQQVGDGLKTIDGNPADFRYAVLATGVLNVVSWKLYSDDGATIVAAGVSIDEQVVVKVVIAGSIDPDGVVRKSLIYVAGDGIDPGDAGSDSRKAIVNALQSDIANEKTRLGSSDSAGSEQPAHVRGQAPGTLRALHQDCIAKSAGALDCIEVPDDGSGKSGATINDPTGAFLGVVAGVLFVAVCIIGMLAI